MESHSCSSGGNREVKEQFQESAVVLCEEGGGSRVYICFQCRPPDLSQSAHLQPVSHQWCRLVFSLPLLLLSIKLIDKDAK
jgi:hypothetical protein